MLRPALELANAPWVRFSGAEALLHCWDIAVSIGVEPNWPEPNGSIHYEMVQTAFPGEARGSDVQLHDATPDAGAHTHNQRSDVWRSDCDDVD